MLRVALAIVGIGITVAAGVLLINGNALAFWPFMIWGPVILGALLIERWRYHSVDDSSSEKWQPTGESFEDPETSEIVDVFYNPVSGDRRYVKRDSTL